MSSINIKGLPLGNTPQVVSMNPHLLTAWEFISVWYDKIVDNHRDKNVFVSHACFIMMACRFINLRVSQLWKEGVAEKMQAGLLIKKMQEVSVEFKNIQAVTHWLGKKSSLQASVEFANVVYNSVYQRRSQYAATPPLSKTALLPVERIWTMISLSIGISPAPEIVKSSDVKTKLTWLQKQSEEPRKRPIVQEEKGDTRSKKAKTVASTAASEALRLIEVLDPQDIDTIKRYDSSIGIVPIEGPVKNRSVVTAYDMLTLALRQLVNDVVIDAHLTLVCHTYNGHFQEGNQLPPSPKYHAWSAQMSNYLSGRMDSFEERHLGQEWPPARYPHAALEDVYCHIFPIHVRRGKGHWMLMVLYKGGDGQWILSCFSSVAGYDRDFAEPWRVISSWLLFKSKGALDVARLQPVKPVSQPVQDNDSDCGVFICGIVRWSLQGWDLSTLTPSVIPEYRRRMILEIERWSLSTNQL